jgi:hypothetical protein
MRWLLSIHLISWTSHNLTFFLFPQIKRFDKTNISERWGNLCKSDSITYRGIKIWVPGMLPNPLWTLTEVYRLVQCCSQKRWAGSEVLYDQRQHFRILIFVECILSMYVINKTNHYVVITQCTQTTDSAHFRHVEISNSITHTILIE